MLAALLVLAAAAAVQPGTLPGIEKQLEKERATAAQLAGREAGLLGRLTELERQIEVEGRAVRAAQARLKASSARLALSETKTRAADAEVARATDALAPRLTARYRLGREGYLRFLLGARTIGEVLRRKRLFNALLESDLGALAELQFRALGAKAARDELAQARDELAKAAAAEGERRAALEQRVAQQKRLLSSVQQEKTVHEQAARELAQAARDLQAKLRELSEQNGVKEVKPGEKTPEGPASKPPPLVASQNPAQPIRKARGKLLFPTERGRVELRFGRTLDPRFGTITLQRGIDVRAAAGTPVRACWPGKIVHAGWFRGYGNLVIVDHGDGFFSLMAHLDALERAVGDEVRQGEEVGTVGDTGSLKGAYLYFELRDGQKPLDPDRWLSRNRKAPGVLVGSARPAASTQEKAPAKGAATP